MTGKYNCFYRSFYLWIHTKAQKIKSIINRRNNMISGSLKVECQRSTTGGKGNRGKYIDRNKRVCAAGVPTAQSELTVDSAFHQYLLKDEADALIGDAIIPPPSPRKLAPLRHPIKNDQRHCGLNSELTSLVNPPMKSKFQTFVDDLKNTQYESYWKKALGRVPDPVPMLPDGFDIENTTFGVKTTSDVRLYDVVMPKNPLPDKTHPSKLAAAQTFRNYCRPAFNPDLTYGYCTNINKQGCYVKTCLTDDRVINGTADHIHTNHIQADIQERTQPLLGKVLAPNNNISCVPEGYSFGMLKCPENLAECLSTCKINPKLSELRKCLAHLNTLRKVMSTRFLPTFFRKFYLSLKYYDNDKTGWLDKKIVYEKCASHLIRFDPLILEPLLCLWNAFDGSKIEYKTFAHVLNFKQPLPELPKVPDIHPDCLDFRTTYTEMVKPGQQSDMRLRAGVPSGRYFDLDYPITPEGYSKADRACLPHESDVNSNIRPSIFTLMHVSHRDMYARREPAIVKRVFEACGEKFTDERFNEVWEAAKKYHSQGWVCFETFRKALQVIPPLPQTTDIEKK